MRRFLFLVALLGAVSFTAGCDDKPKSGASGNAPAPGTTAGTGGTGPAAK